LEVEAEAADAEMADAEVADAEVAEAAKAEAAEAEHQRQRNASEVAACIGGIGMHRKMEPTVNTKCRRQSKRSELCQNLLGQDGTCLGLLLLHVGLNGEDLGVRHLWNITLSYTKILQAVLHIICVLMASAHKFVGHYRDF
jgi:hypothetical protein